MSGITNLSVSTMSLMRRGLNREVRCIHGGIALGSERSAALATDHTIYHAQSHIHSTFSLVFHGLTPNLLLSHPVGRAELDRRRIAA